MLEYRLYMLDATGALQFPEEFEAPDDGTAIARADEFCVNGKQMELWRARRKVHCWGFDDCPSDCERPAAAN